MKKNHPKMKALEWSQHFSHYKSMRIFSNAQGQLTPQSLVRSCQISNPFEILLLSLLPAKTSSPKGDERSPGASIMFGDIIIDDAQRQVTLNLIQ